MAERQTPTTLLRRLQSLTPTSTHAVGILTLLITGAALLLLLATAAAAAVALIFLAPLLILTSPLWLPLAVLLFVAASVFVALGGSAVAAFAAASWAYRYFRGQHPVGSDRVDYARGQIVSTAGHVGDYARECVGYPHRKVKDAAPGA